MESANKIHKLAVFDFCETIADFQTASAFVDFVRHNTNSFGVRLRNGIYVLMVKGQVVRLLTVLTAHKYFIGKKLKLWQLKGLSQDFLEAQALRFYEERVKPHLIGATISRLKELQGEGYTVGLSSGGYGLYLRHFVKEYGIGFCQCSEIGFRKGKCTGKMAGADCMREEKVRRLSKEFGEDCDGSLAFSDSISDLPLLQWASTGVVVSRGEHQRWVEKYGFQEIIW